MDKLNIESSSSGFKRKPVIIIVVGMAGNPGNPNGVVLMFFYMLHIRALIEIQVISKFFFGELECCYMLFDLIREWEDNIPS